MKDDSPTSFNGTRTTGCGVLLREPKNWRKLPNLAESLAELLVEARSHPRLWYLYLMHRIYRYMMYNYNTRNLHRLWYPIGIFWEETSWRRAVLSFCYLGLRVTFFAVFLLGTSPMVWYSMVWYGGARKLGAGLGRLFFLAWISSLAIAVSTSFLGVQPLLPFGFRPEERIGMGAAAVAAVIRSVKKTVPTAEFLMVGLVLFLLWV